jgi:hypothetical protein
MYSPPSRMGYPLGRFRLIGSIVPAVGFGFMLFQASITLNLFTPVRQLYLVLGIVEGMLLGTVEARLILQGLSKNAEAIVWKPLPISTVLVLSPFLVVLAVFGVPEYMPFGAYFVLSAIPAYLATGGWFLTSFEKENRVRIFVSPFGFKYWREPIEDLSDRFSHFIREVVEKQASALWYHVGYSGRFIELLKKRQDIEPKTQKELIELLKVMSRYRKLALVVLASVIGSGIILLLFLFVVASGIIRIPARQLGNIVGPGSGVIFFSALAAVALGMWKFKKTVSIGLARIDANKLSSV